jgi:polysaccharide export outer membrane protein
MRVELARRSARASRRWFGLALGALAIPAAALADPATQSRAYSLAPGDRITVTILGQPELSGDMPVDGDGNIMMPFIGPIAVKDLTIVECQKVIHDRLADGLLSQPSVSVRIGEVRPLSILGDVRVPGVYPFRYGSTVKGAVAAAGGFGPAEAVQGTLLAEYLLADERVRQLSLQRQSLLIRQTRIEAQRNDLTSFSVAPQPQGSGDGNVAETIAIEKSTIETEAVILQNELDLLRAQKPRLQSEIQSLTGQIATTKKQLALVTQHADEYSRMVKQGLGLSNTELELRVSQANQENELWRLTAQLSRLQMDVGDLDIKILEAEASFKRQKIAELRDVRERLADLDVTLPSAIAMRELKLRQVGGLAGAEHIITVTRPRNGQAAVLQATEETPLEPGDLVEVKRPLQRDTSAPSALVPPPGARPSQMGEITPDKPIASASP